MSRGRKSCMDRLAGQKKNMAASNIDSLTDESKEKIILTENDIPGAKIPRESLEHCSVPQLKRWLLCRGAKTTGKKAALIARIKDYQKNGLSSKYLRDPDGGINILKKKAELGALESTEPVTSSFPKEGFNCDINGIPKLTFGTIWRFMIDSVECKKELSTAKPLVKGYNFYKSGHVLFISHLSENGRHYVKSEVLSSMKKNAVYTCCIVFTSIGNVLRAHCGCPAGIDGRCNHVAATLFSLEEFCKSREKQNTDSCTSKPCKWNVPRNRTGDVEPIAQMTFSKHDYNKSKKAEKTTQGQSDDLSWYVLRKYRITASQCHRVATLRESTSPTKTIQQVLMMSTQYQSKSMKEGIEMEDQIIKEYVLEMQQRGHVGIAVHKCGFFICKENGFLGASPDGLVDDPTVSQPQGLIEVKYIQNQEDESLNDSLIRKRICVQRHEPVLNTKHKYFYQVQQQMYVTNRNWTDFVVKGSHGTDIFCQRIEFARAFWEETHSKLHRFYDQWIAPEIAYPRVKNGLQKFGFRSA